MSLNFTDDQLKDLSRQILEIPTQILLEEANKAKAEEGQQVALDNDGINKVFFDNFNNIVNQYHAESAEIDSVTFTAYVEQTLIDSAQQLPGNLHFPSAPPWVNFTPKQIPENTGLPTGALSVYEQDELTKVTDKITQLKSGFTSGAITDTLANGYSTGSPFDVNIGGFVLGQRVVLDSGGGSNYVVGTITNAQVSGGPGVQELEITEEFTVVGTLAVGAQIRNFHPGFSNAEREAGVAADFTNLLLQWESELDAEVDLWESTLNNQDAALSANDATGAEATQNAAAQVDVQAALADITTWEAAPGTGVGTGRYGDTVLAATIESRITARVSETAARITEIATSLGTLSQAGDGVFSGTNNYLSVFTWIDLRISKAGGSLFTFYNFDTIIKFIDLRIDALNNKKDEYEDTFLVQTLSVDADGTVFVTLNDVTGLSNGNSVSLMDNVSAVIPATIVDIIANVVELDTVISGLTVAEQARLVKQL
jgi:hypothetical protein